MRKLLLELGTPLEFMFLNQWNQCYEIKDKFNSITYRIRNSDKKICFEYKHKEEQFRICGEYYSCIAITFGYNNKLRDIIGTILKISVKNLSSFTYHRITFNINGQKYPQGYKN